MNFPQNVKEIATLQYAEHVKRRPQIDWLCAQERMWRWKNWKENAKLHVSDIRNNAPHFLCHNQYSEEDKKVFKENNIKYCEGYCGSLCKYLNGGFKCPTIAQD